MTDDYKKAKERPYKVSISLIGDFIRLGMNWVNVCGLHRAIGESFPFSKCRFPDLEKEES